MSTLPDPAPQLWKVTAEHSIGLIDSDLSQLSRHDADVIAEALAGAGFENIEVSEDNGPLYLEHDELRYVTLMVGPRALAALPECCVVQRPEGDRGKRGSADWKEHTNRRGKRRRW